MYRMLLLPPGVDAKHPKEYEHVERDGQRDQREDHPAVGANPEESRVVDAVVDLELLRSTRENLVGRLGARSEKRARRPGFSSVDAMRILLESRPRAARVCGVLEYLLDYSHAAAAPPSV